MSDITDFQDALQELWNNYTPEIEYIWTSLACAKELGVDISAAPTDSICRIGPDGAKFYRLGDDGTPIE